MTFRYQHGDRPLEGYTILRGIGRGGFGEVYYAMSDGGREVALKVIQQNHEIELRGIQHCINLKNPHLVSIFDVKTSADGVPFVVMEFVAGPSLRDIVREAPRGLGVPKAAFLALEIAKGLSYLHERGIVHRDLKPENIFFEDGYVKIGDYGLSKYISVSRQSGQTISVGTVHYMAPEIGSGNYSQGIDVYSLGIILYELLSGTVPFDGDSMGEILIKHLTAEPDLTPVPEAFRHVVAKALAKDPKSRYLSARELSEALLQAGDTRKLLDGFDPTSISTASTAASFRHPAAGRMEPTTPGPPGAPAAPGIAAPAADGIASPAPAPAPARPASPAAPQAFVDRHAPTIPLEARRRSDLEQRLVHAIVTAVAMAFALTLFAGRSHGVPGFFGSLFLVAGCAAAVCFVECWGATRFQIAPGVGRRLVTMGAGTPVLLVANGLFGLSNEFVTLILAGLVLIDWSLRTKPNRKEQVSFQLAFTAGLCGAIAAALLKDDMIFGGGLMAAVSLAVGALAPYAPETRSRKARADRHADEADAPLPVGAGSPAAGPSRPSAPAALPPPAPATFVVETPSGPSPLSASGTLRRPLDDRVVAGVCAGIARRYGLEIVWLRAAFVLGALFGAGLIVYLVLWLCMPSETSPRKADFRLVRILGRIVLIALGGYLGFLGFISTFVEAPPFFGGSRAQNALAGGVLFFGLALAAWATAAAIGARPRGVRARPTVSPGWASLGAVFMALAVLPVVVGTLMVSDAGGAILENTRLAEEPWIRDFGRSGEHLAIAAIFFLFGMFCVLFGRRDGGAFHVLRGAIGWSLAAGLVVLLSRVGGSVLATRPGSLGSVRLMPSLFVVLAAAGLSALCIAWPRSPGRETEPGGEGGAPVRDRTGSGRGLAIALVLAAIASAFAIG